MDDLISRQAAIDALDVLCQEHRYKIPGKFETYSKYNEAWQDALDRAEGAIGNLPPAQQWVPVSERLPEEGVPVLGTFEFQSGRVCLTTERITINGKERWSASCGLKPIAWMPLPEAYKGE